MANDIRALINQAITEVMKISGDDRIVVGTALESIMALPSERLHSALLERIEDVKRTQTLLNALDMSESELDALAANFLVVRDQGGKSTGSVRVYFGAPQTYSVPRGASFKTDDGLRFFVRSEVLIYSASMQLNVDAGRYFVDVPYVEAESEGDKYNIAAGKITSFSQSTQSVLAVKNLVPFTGGRKKETNAEFLVRIQEAVTVRDLNIRRAIYTLVRQNFPAVKYVYSSGFGDIETGLDVRFGVHGGGDVLVHVQGPKPEASEQVLTGFSEELQLIANGKTAQIGFIRSRPIIEGSKRWRETKVLGGTPAFAVLDGHDVDDPVAGGDDIVDEIDINKPHRVKQRVTDEPQSFPGGSGVGGTFFLDNPARVTADLVIKSIGTGARYFCKTHYDFNPATGVVTRLDDAMDDDVYCSYTWTAINGVDYEINALDAKITALAGGLLTTGDEIEVDYWYFRVGKRDDTNYTVTSVPVSRIVKAEVVDDDDNPIEEMVFVPPVEDGTEFGWSWASAVAAAPSDKPWFTWRVLPYQDLSPEAYDDRHLLLDPANIFSSYRGITSQEAFAGQAPWPHHGCLRYTQHEEIALYFVNSGVVPLGSSSRVRLTCESDSVVRSVQGYLSDPERRVLCARQLARSFVPAYVSIALYGLKGDSTKVVTAISDYLNALEPGIPLTVSSVAAVILDPAKGGATGVTLPFSLNVRIMYPDGTVEDLTSTSAIDIDAELESIGSEHAEQKFVSSRNIKFLPGTIEAKS